MDEMYEARNAKHCLQEALALFNENDFEAALTYIKRATSWTEACVERKDGFITKALMERSRGAYGRLSR